jgi:hypothetical protein
MKKIMFNDKYGLTRAVLERRKTQTRRLITCYACNQVLTPLHYQGSTSYDDFAIEQHAKYKVGEEVWIAQSYQSLGYKPDDWIENIDGGMQPAHELAGYTNKMFVRSLYLEHRIRITGVRVERLQSISDEDCMREGVFKYEKEPLHHERDPFAPWPPYVKPYKHDIDNLKYYCNPKAAFAHLIDRVSGGGTWRKNPWVFVYDFELLY